MIQLSEPQAHTVWFATKAYMKRLNKDLETRYDYDPSFSREDADFLTEQINRCQAVLDTLVAQGIKHA